MGPSAWRPVEVAPWGRSGIGRSRPFGVLPALRDQGRGVVAKASLPLITPEIEACLTQDIETRPTEIFVPVQMEVAPVWSHEHGRAGWYARLMVPFAGDAIALEELECDHVHDTKDEAWPCAETLAQDLARNLLDGKGA